MVYLNNLLSLPLILGLMVFYGELPGVMKDPALKVGEPTASRCRSVGLLSDVLLLALALERRLMKKDNPTEVMNHHDRHIQQWCTGLATCVLMC